MLGAAVKAAFEAGAPGLKLVEQRILSRLSSDAAALPEIAEYLLSLGGKRIRPLLTLLSAQLCGMKAPSEELIDVAAGIELIHMATLLHDDIIDESPLRRSQESAYKRYGLPKSLLTGDFLLVRAFGLCAKLDRHIIEATERACVTLTEGEVLEEPLHGESEQNFESYLTVVSKKTASLFELATEVGAHLSGWRGEERETLRRFGYLTGVAFQMIDDILDVTADENLLGKPSGTDLRQKTPSLVNIVWLAESPREARAFFTQATIDHNAAKQVARELCNSRVIEISREHARRYAAQANSELSKLDASQINATVRDQLSAIVEYTLHRCL